MHVLKAFNDMSMGRNVHKHFKDVWDVGQGRKIVEVRELHEGLYKFVELDVAIRVTPPHHHRPQHVDH